MTNENPTLILDAVAIEHLKTTRKWSSFLSTLAFILLGLMTVGLVFLLLFGFGLRVGGLSGREISLQVVSILLMILLYYFPVYYLHQFGKYSNRAIHNHDSDALTIALGYLGRHYRYIGIMSVVLLFIYLVAILGLVMWTVF